jgi:hypothetical protein
MPRPAAGGPRALIATHSPDSALNPSRQQRPIFVAFPAGELLTEIADAEESGQWVRAAQLRARFRSIGVGGEGTPPPAAA